MGCASSRAFKIGESATPSLLPLIDLCNHSFSPNCRLESGSDGTARLVACRDIQPQQPLQIDYGHLSNTTLLQDYGFIVSDNPFDEVHMQLSVDSIQVRPASLLQKCLCLCVGDCKHLKEAALEVEPSLVQALQLITYAALLHWPQVALCVDRWLRRWQASAFQRSRSLGRPSGWRNWEPRGEVPPPSCAAATPCSMRAWSQPSGSCVPQSPKTLRGQATATWETWNPPSLLVWRCVHLPLGCGADARLSWQGTPRLELQPVF